MSDKTDPWVCRRCDGWSTLLDAGDRGKVCPKCDGWKSYRKLPVVVRARPAVEGEQITTLEGTMTASDGDYIIEGVKGEQYPCKPDVFRATYEEVKP
jgi:hypothetical protein